MSSTLVWAFCFVLIFFDQMFQGIQSWRGLERFSNSNIVAPTGSNKSRQGHNALRTLLKVFGGNEADAVNFVMKNTDQNHMSDTALLNTVMENLSNLSLKLIHPVTKFLTLKSNQL